LRGKALTDLLSGPRFALVIATTKYGDPRLTQLRAPARDADHLAAVLADARIGRFDVTRQLDWAAQDSRLGIADFLTDRDVDDLLVIYLSCHGLRDRHGRLYFASTDTRIDRLGATGLDSRWLLEQLDDCRARRQVVILDCCFSGAFSGPIKARASGALGEQDLTERLVGHGRGRAILTASRAYEYSFEGEPLPDARPTGSVFTTALVEGLRTGKADTNRDGYISVEEAYDYAYDHLQKQGAAQTPQKWLYGGESAIWLAASPARPSVKPTTVSRAMRAELQSDSLDEALGAVTTLRNWLASGDAAKVISARRELEDLSASGGPIADYARAVLTQSPPPKPSEESRLLVSDRRTWIRCLSYSPDGLLLGSGDDAGAATLWDTRTAAERHVLSGHSDWVRGLAFSPSGRLLVTAADDGLACVWDPAVPTQPPGELIGHRGGINSVMFSRDGSVVITAGSDRTVRFWEPVTCQLMATLDESGQITWDAATDPDGTMLASADDDGAVRLWNAESHRHIATLAGHQGAARRVVIHPQGRILASAGDDGYVRVWDLTEGQQLHALAGYQGAALALAFHPDGNLLATSGEDADIHLWDPATGQLLHTLRGHRGWVRGLTFNPSGSTLASAGKDGVIRLWNLVP